MRKRLRSRAGRIALLAAATAVIALLGFMYGQSRRLVVEPVDFAPAGLPAAFDGYRIAFISDVHHGPFMSRERVARMVDMVNASHPDAIMLGGDYVFSDGKYFAPVFAELARLRAPDGVFAVRGNHEYRQGAEMALSEMSRVGIVNLENRGRWIKRGTSRLRLAGVEELWNGRPNLAAALGDARPDDVVVLASHNPDFAGQVPPGAVDLVLAGHTHGGQITFFGRWAPLLFSTYGQRYRSGLTREGPVPTLVSNGVGTIAPPLRFYAPAQVVVVTLRRH